MLRFANNFGRLDSEFLESSLQDSKDSKGEDSKNHNLDSKEITESISKDSKALSHDHNEDSKTLSPTHHPISGKDSKNLSPSHDKDSKIKDSKKDSIESKEQNQKLIEQRNALFNAILQEKNTGKSGYYELPFTQRALQDSINYKNANKKLLKSLTHIVIIGIGGSSLGTRAIDTLLNSLKNRNEIKLKFLEHTDSIATKKILKNIKLKSTLFIVISKSGSTIETTSLLKFCINKFALLDAKKHLLVITDSNSPLQKWAKENGVQNIAIESSVGGRFSVLSSVGILPLSLLGYKVEKILQGAKEFFESFLRREQEHILSKALFYAKHRDKYPINVLFSYSSVFSDFNAWYIQLWGESLGKINADNKRGGLTPISLLGSIDQHSFLQLILEGKADKSVTFLRLSCGSVESLKIPNVKLSGLESTNFVNGVSFLKLLNSQCKATMQVMDEQDIPLDSIILERLNERTIGSLIMYYELLTSSVGILLNINTYDQPAVEKGKKLLSKILA
ncbi:glucose-6-phosphate isomerase [Helicobacter saguini]|uniref:Glucose-6-phosphate isomerase n=1 Tax=Helicobacter saguini TaxID=1548018 RepID=A0A347VWT5_9HELI|nr:glucose-6-phosphate isomerase [Helicobacter saguini]MWV61897.1 glucose-6-phosphate isomerase [Helicobacter saguini]MWV67428.1 glucose-6-phosphate isomerase [Helicobacter saguini]MWV69781.1 glucose-6-phosphate isomerase [Helicobacter saguini]MWV73002.1 glucose-6-phosphate isomerase [Helicobacter saguini]TLD95618.1 glucose-6-phosphate isomerase [Helicobacter saguini]